MARVRAVCWQYYNLRKRAETMFKSFHYKSSDISAVRVISPLSISSLPRYAVCSMAETRGAHRHCGCPHGNRTGNARGPWALGRFCRKGEQEGRGRGKGRLLPSGPCPALARARPLPVRGPWATVGALHSCLECS